MTPDAVRCIRRAYEDGATQADLAARYGLSRAAVQKIVTGATWPDAGGPICRQAARGRPRKDERRSAVYAGVGA